jgi:hypothetical protein
MANHPASYSADENVKAVACACLCTGASSRERIPTKTKQAKAQTERQKLIGMHLMTEELRDCRAVCYVDAPSALQCILYDKLSVSSHATAVDHWIRVSAVDLRNTDLLSHFSRTSSRRKP